jgi:hypothetical protein
MESPREELVRLLREHYRGHGWKVRDADDQTLEADGPGGVTWLGTAVTAEDLSSGGLEERLLELSDRRMPAGGELCPLDLLPAEEAEPRLRALLDRIGLSDRPHVSVYSLAA